MKMANQREFHDFEISRAVTNNPAILIDRLATITLIRESAKRLKQYPPRKIKSILPPGIKKLMRKLLKFS